MILWGIKEPHGILLYKTCYPSQKECIKNYCNGNDNGWDHLIRIGFECVPVKIQEVLNEDVQSPYKHIMCNKYDIPTGGCWNGVDSNTKCKGAFNCDNFAIPVKKQKIRI